MTVLLRSAGHSIGARLKAWEATSPLNWPAGTPDLPAAVVALDSAVVRNTGANTLT